MNEIITAIHGQDFVDQASFATGLIFCIFVYFRRKQYQPFTHPRITSLTTASDIATGAALFPLVVLAISIFDHVLLHNLITYDRIVLSLAAAFAFFAMLDEAWKGAEGGGRH